jgi:hypothetical protein
MLAPLVALAVGFSAPQSKLPAPALADSKLLALRGGGISTDALYNTVIGITGAVGFQGWLAPKKTIEMYGVADMSTTESVFLRTLSSMNVATAVTLIAAKTDVEKAFLVGWIAWILASTANVPMFDAIGTPSGPVIVTIGVFSAVAGLAATGTISMDVAGYILLAGLVPMSIFEAISPKAIFDGYGLPQPSPLVKSLFENFSFTKLALGSCLLVTKLTGKPGLGLAAFASVSAVNCIKTLTRADDVGLAKPGLIVWTVFMSAVAAMAYLNEK